MRIAVATACAVSALVVAPAAEAAKAKPISADNAAAMSGQTIAVTQRELPDFSAMTSSKAQLGMAGAFMMIGVGNGIVRDNHIEDPAVAMAADLAQTLAAARGATVVETPVAAKGQNPKEIAAAAGEAKYVVDVATTYWGYMYQSFDWSHYSVLYMAKLKVIDVSTKAVIAEGQCKWKPAKDAKLPTAEELLANEAAEVKAQLAQARDACAAEFKRDVLGGL
jgi:hypothetical protein